MIDYIKKNHLSLLIIVFLLASNLLAPAPEDLLGASPSAKLTRLTNLLSLGTNGTAHSKFISGTCNASQAVAGSHAATSSKEFLCAATGVSAGDKVFVSLPAGAGAYSAGGGSNLGGFIVGGTFATTSNYFGFSMTNLTVSATSSYAQATTSVQYWVVDN
jgi:hypothetical protein